MATNSQPVVSLKPEMETIKVENEQKPNDVEQGDNTIDINRSNTSEKTSSENTQHSINESVKESGTKTTETTKTNEDSTSETTTQSGTKETSIDSTKNKDSNVTEKETGKGKEGDGVSLCCLQAGGKDRRAAWSRGAGDGARPYPERRRPLSL